MAKQVNFNGYLLRQFGAYIRTDLSALVQINGVASGIIGITGLAEKGPTNTATTLTSYTQLVNTFGDGPLVRHGLAAYIGGANTLVAVRLDDSGTSNAASSASLTVVDSTDAYTFSAKEKGTYGDNISVRVRTPVFHSASPITASDASLYSSDYAVNGIIIPIPLASDVTADIGEYAVVNNWDSDAADGLSSTDYTIFQWNGSIWSPVEVSSVVSTITVRLGSVEESVQVPYYVDETSWVKNLAHNTASDYYRVLKNVNTNQIRPIPNNWFAAETAATLTEDRFDEIINELKGDDEVVLGQNNADFSLTLGQPTEFPFTLAESIVNYGGFGQGPSSFVTVAETGNETTTVFVAQGFTNLVGGSNSEDGTNWVSTLDTDNGNFTSSPGAPTTAWEKALAVFENEEVNFIQPAYFFADNSSFTSKYSFFKSLAAKIVTHVNLMSNTPNRKFRTSILGIPSGKNGSTNLTSAEFLNQTQDITGTVNSDRIQLWAGGFYSTALEVVTTPRLYGADWLASFAVGAHAAREVSVSLTFAPISGIFTDGLEYPWTTSQKDDLYGRSLAFALKRRTSTGATEYVSAHNYTSFTGAPSRGIQLFITRRITDYMNTFVYKNLEENFIGRKSRGATTANEISEFVTALLNRLISEDHLVAFANLSVEADATDKTLYYVEYDFQPVTEIDFLLTTNKLVYNLA